MTASSVLFRSGPVFTVGNSYAIEGNKKHESHSHHLSHVFNGHWG
jgi:hypothetical protein